MYLNVLVLDWFPPRDDRVVYSSKELLSATNNDILPTLQKSNVIYQFLCLRYSQYVGRKYPLLSFPERTVPARLCKSSIQNNTQYLASDSAIGLDLLQKLACSLHYDDSRFFFLPLGRCSFHLSALEPLSSKLPNPSSADKKIHLQFRDCTLMSNDSLSYSLVFLHSITVRRFFLSIAIFILRSPFWRFFWTTVRRKATSKTKTFWSKQFSSSVPPINDFCKSVQAVQ